MHDIPDLRLYMKGIPVSLQDTSDSSFHIRCRAFQSRKQAAPLKQPGNNRPLLLQYASTFSVYQKTAVTKRYIFHILYTEAYAEADRRMLERVEREVLEKTNAACRIETGEENEA